MEALCMLPAGSGQGHYYFRYRPFREPRLHFRYESRLVLDSFSRNHNIHANHVVEPARLDAIIS